MTPRRQVILVEPEPVEQIEPGVRRDRQGADIIGKLILDARSLVEVLSIGKPVALADEQAAVAASEAESTEFEAVGQARTGFQPVDAGEAIARE
jgi:hypothetical protein